MKINYQGQDIEAAEIEVISGNECWNEFQLADGKMLRYKEVLISVYKIEGKLNPDGSQVYQFKTNKVVEIR